MMMMIKQLNAKSIPDLGSSEDHHTKRERERERERESTYKTLLILIVGHSNIEITICIELLSKRLHHANIAFNILDFGLNNAI